MRGTLAKPDVWTEGEEWYWTLQHGINENIPEKLSQCPCAVLTSFLWLLPIPTAVWGSKGSSSCVFKLSSSRSWAPQAPLAKAQ